LGAEGNYGVINVIKEARIWAADYEAELMR